MVCSPHRYIVEDLARKAYFTAPIMPRYQVSFGVGGYKTRGQYGQGSLYQVGGQAESWAPYSSSVVEESRYQMGGLYQRNSMWLPTVMDVITPGVVRVEESFRSEPGSGGQQRAHQGVPSFTVPYKSDIEYVPMRNAERGRVVGEGVLEIKSKKRDEELAELIQRELSGLQQGTNLTEGDHV